MERLVAASAIAAAAVVVVAMGAALLGGGPAPDTGPSPESSGAAVAPVTPAGTSGPPTPGSPGTGSPSTAPGTDAPRPAATPLPAYVAPAGPVAGLSIGAIAEDGWRWWTWPPGPHRARSPAGRVREQAVRPRRRDLPRACAAFEGRDARVLRLTLRRYDALGRPGDEVAWLGYEAGSGSPPGAGGALPVSIDPAISADGRMVAVGWTAWDGAFWRSGVDVVDVTPGRPSSGTSR